MRARTIVKDLPALKFADKKHAVRDFPDKLLFVVKNVFWTFPLAKKKKAALKGQI